MESNDIVRGWLNGTTAEVGTVFGPNIDDEFFTVKEVDIAGNRVLLRRARIEDMTFSQGHIPRSLTEIRLMQR